MAKQLAASKIIPDSYQNNPANCMVALEMASRMQASPLAVMQNCDVIQRPSKLPRHFYDCAHQQQP